MSDLTALAQKIAALAANDAVYEGGARVISAAGEPAPLVAILSEIDETILERTLEINADGKTLRLVAAGRRLRGIAAVDAPGAEAVIGQSLSREEPEVLQGVFDVLSNACGDVQHLRVRPLPAEPFGKGGERGVSAKGLAEIWGVDIDTAPAPPFERFLKIANGAASSLIYLNAGEVIDQKGDADALHVILDTQLAAFQAQQAKLSAVGDGPQLVSLENALADGSSATLVVSGEQIVLIAHDAGAIGPLHRAWKALMG